MKIKHIIPALGMALLACGLQSCSDDEQPVLKRSTDELSFTYLNSTKNLYVLTNENWQIEPNDEWISCTPSQGGPSASEQVVEITVKQNDGEAREGSVTLTDGVKHIDVTVKQEDGFFYLGTPIMPDAVIVFEKISGKHIEIPYYKSKPGYVASVSCELLLDGKPSEEISVSSIENKELGIGEGVLSLELSGEPTVKGVLTANITVDINGNKTKMEGSCRVRLESELTVNIYKLLPRLAIVDWGNYTRGTGTNGDNGTSRDFDFELATEKYGAPIRRNVTKKTNWLVSAMFWGENRFVYGNLTPGTEYWFRIVQKNIGPKQDQVSDTTYISFTTPAEEPLPANTVFYDDFDRFCIKGNLIYRAFGVAVSNANVGKNFDPNNPDDFLKNTGIATPATTMDPLYDKVSDASHNLNYKQCPKVWEHYWQTDVYGYENIANPELYDGWSGKMARQNAGCVMVGAATSAGSHLRSPKFAKLGDTPTDITIVTNTAAYHEPYHSWEEDCLCHYIIIEGPGSITDAGSTKAVNVPATAEANTDKQVVVQMAPNKIGAGKGSINSHNFTTRHVIKVSGATKDTRVVLKNITPGSDAPHCRFLIDDILVTKD